MIGSAFKRRMCCLQVAPDSQPAYGQRATSSKWFNNCCRYIKALDEGSTSPHLRTPVSSSGSPVHNESKGGKQNLASWCGCPAVNKERGQRLPGFSCQGRPENSLLHLRCRCVPVQASLSQRKAPSHLTAAAGLSQVQVEMGLFGFVWGKDEEGDRKESNLLEGLPLRAAEGIT